MTAPVLYLAPIYSPRVLHCYCLGSGHPEYVDPECCVCWKQPCARGERQMWRHLTAELIHDLSPTYLAESPF